MTRKVNFVDVTLRDGHQSLAATRMTTEQALRVLKMIDDAGFAALELWGGATLDSCIRFLNEDPWERLEKFQEVLGSSKKIRALLRGQNLFAYQPYPDDMVIAFVKQAVKSGVGIMRIFDALNDWRNLQVAMLATGAHGGVIEGALSYTTSPVHTTEYFVKFAKKLEDEGAHQVAVKDMAGLLHPTAALDLFRALKKTLSVPVVMHSHTTTGVATLNAVIAMHEGIDYIDTAITPFAGGTSHPPIEVVIVFAEEMGLDPGLDKELILKAQEKLFPVFEELDNSIPDAMKTHRPVHYNDVDRKKVNEILNLVGKGTKESVEQAIPLMRELLASLSYPGFNDKIFDSQIPGGMISNLYNQLKGMDQLHMLDKIMEEVPRVRKDAGYVPLVTPTSQIVGTQAAFNVMSEEAYQMVSAEFKMILKGEFGKAPGSINEELLNKALEPGEEPLKYRAASYLKPILEDVPELPFVKTHKDMLLHFLFRQSADTFLKRRYRIYDDPNEARIAAEQRAAELEERVNKLESRVQELEGELRQARGTAPVAA
jgi:pyruvate/oxaloacetate carboxyltransferase